MCALLIGNLNCDQYFINGFVRSRYSPNYNFALRDCRLREKERERALFLSVSLFSIFYSLSFLLYYGVRLHRAAITSGKKIRTALCFVMRAFARISESGVLFVTPRATS